MKVLITGAAGFLGRQFLRYHVARGDTIVAVDNQSSEGAYWPSGVYSRRRVDAGDWFRDNKDEFDRAYHFAAPVGGRIRIEGDPLYNADSLRLDSAFFRWAPGKVGTAVYPSSSAVYGTIHQTMRPSRLHEVLFDPGSDAWDVPDEMYGFTKMAGEVLAAKAAGYGLNTLCIRPFSGYGEEQSKDYPVTSICARAARREDPLLIWGSGQQSRDFIHVDDLVAATLAFVDRGISGYEAVNLGSGVATTFTEVAQLAAGIEGYEPTIITDPSKPEGVAVRYADVTKMREVYEPKISLIDGLTRVMDSFWGQRKEVP